MNLNVFNFDNYRSFLQAYCEHKKSSERHFSLARWAQRLSLRSSSTLIMILKGTRNPSERLVEALIVDMDLNGEAAEYFRNLVNLEKTKNNQHLQAIIFEQLPPRSKPPAQVLPREYLKLVSQWYFTAIRELADLPGFREDPAWIQSRLRFPVEQEQIRAALKVLVELELLRRDDQEQLHYSKSVTSPYEIPREDSGSFHKSGLEVCAQAVDTVDAQDRETVNATLTCSKKDLPLIKKRIRQFVAEIQGLSNEAPDAVFMVQVNCVPLTR